MTSSGSLACAEIRSVTIVGGPGLVAGALAAAGTLTIVPAISIVFVVPTACAVYNAIQSYGYQNHGLQDSSVATFLMLSAVGLIWFGASYGVTAIVTALM